MEVRAQIERADVAAKTPGVLCEHLFSLSPEGLREQTAVNDSLTRWQAVTKIVTAKEHLYFFIGPCLAHVIPRRAFRDEQDANTLSTWLASLYTSI